MHRNTEDKETSFRSFLAPKSKWRKKTHNNNDDLLLRSNSTMFNSAAGNQSCEFRHSHQIQVKPIDFLKTYHKPKKFGNKSKPYLLCSWQKEVKGGSPHDEECKLSLWSFTSENQEKKEGCEERSETGSCIEFDPNEHSHHQTYPNLFDAHEKYVASDHRRAVDQCDRSYINLELSISSSYYH